MMKYNDLKVLTLKEKKTKLTLILEQNLFVKEEYITLNSSFGGYIWLTVVLYMTKFLVKIIGSTF